MLTGLGAIDTELLQAQLQHDYNHSDTLTMINVLTLEMDYLIKTLT